MASALLLSSCGAGTEESNLGATPGTNVTAITRHDVTWEFASNVLAGRFVTGDWWVVGPAELVRISPETTVLSDRIVHGSMINPGPNQIPDGLQGYDTLLFGEADIATYKPLLNVAEGVSSSSPLLLQPGTSLISSVSWTSSDVPESASQANMKSCSVLTVLDQAPPMGSFRPAYAGSDKTAYYNESDLNWGALATLAIPPVDSGPMATPEIAEVAARFQRVWLDHRSGWSARYMHPVDHMPDYSRDFTALYGSGALLANMDYEFADKRELVLGMVQIGIDFWGNVQNGASWQGVGGQCSGRKFPILFAGRLLNDAQMLSVGTTHPSGYFGVNSPNNRESFGEDCQTFYVEETSPGIYNWGYGGYDETYVGLPEWGGSHTTFLFKDNAMWEEDPYRRCCTANAWVGQTLAARIMGLRESWAHPAYFDYVDRYMQIEPVGEWTRSWDRWQQRMWDLHRADF